MLKPMKLELIVHDFSFIDLVKLLSSIPDINALFISHITNQPNWELIFNNVPVVIISKDEEFKMRYYNIKLLHLQIDLENIVSDYGIHYSEISKNNENGFLSINNPSQLDLNFFEQITDMNKIEEYNTLFEEIHSFSSQLLSACL